MTVPDDVTLLWVDDNWGNIRRFPIASERGRSGGAGVYYHYDYVGSPRDYKWITVCPFLAMSRKLGLTESLVYSTPESLRSNVDGSCSRG